MTPTQVKEFAQDVRQLASQLRNFRLKYEMLTTQVSTYAKRVGFTKREQQRVDRALMVFEVELEALTGKKL